MHKSVHAYVASEIVGRGLADKSVLEVGSYDVNGTVRDLFTGPYRGVDSRPGPGVDEAIEVGPSFPGFRRHDVGLCLEVLEHARRPWDVVLALVFAVKHEGIIILTARGYDSRGVFPIHDYPGDYWRFTPTALAEMLEWAGCDVLSAIPDPEAPGAFATGQVA